VLDMYALDFDWGSGGNILIQPQPCCRIVIELFDQASPLACENFEAFCTGSRGKSKLSGLALHYKNVKFHRVLPGFIAQGGDFVMQNGSGGESVWGKKFKDDKGGLALKHNKAGIVSMCNSGKNSNTCQFFFTFAPCPQLDGKHVVFGQIISGFEVLEAMCVAAGSSPDSVPEQDIVITECGVWTPDMPSQG
jgi:peptidylprolyl isomerase